MNFVLAKIKRQRKKPFMKLLSDCSLYSNISDIDFAMCVEYDSDHNLDDDAWFKIEGFSGKCYSSILESISNDSKSYNDIDKKCFSEISYIVSVQEGVFCFQKVTPSMYLRGKMLIEFGENVRLEKNGHKIFVSNEPDALYFEKEDYLLFKKLSSLINIFDGIDSLYKEATETETKDFLALDFIEISGGYTLDKVSKPNRKRISMVREILNSIAELEREKFIDYINEYCKDKLSYDAENKKFRIENDANLKDLLYGIDERYYTTRFRKERRMANSIVRV